MHDITKKPVYFIVQHQGDEDGATS